MALSASEQVELAAIESRLAGEEPDLDDTLNHLCRVSHRDLRQLALAAAGFAVVACVYVPVGIGTHERGWLVSAGAALLLVVLAGVGMVRAHRQRRRHRGAKGTPPAR